VEFTYFRKILFKKACISQILDDIGIRSYDQYMEIKPQIMEDILSRFIDLYHPKEIFLYGSYAWGSPTVDSDLDFCVILNRSDQTQADRIRDGLRALKGISVPIDILVLTESEIVERKDHPSTLIFKIYHQGKKLYEAA